MQTLIYPAIATLACAFLATAGVQADDEILRIEANNGNLAMEDVPPIPRRIVDDLNRYQNVRSARFLDWATDRDGAVGGIYIATRFGNVDQIHLVEAPGAMRRQLTYYEDPIGQVARQPGGTRVVFTRDTGGSEFSQVFLLDPDRGEALMLTDGESRNGAVLWNRRGEKLAYQSTRRNGASNDVWLMDPGDPDAAEMILESPDGTWWGPVDFSRSGSRLLIQNYVSIADARALVLDLDTAQLKRLAGGNSDSSSSANFALGFDAAEEGFWLITDQGGEFQQLAWQSLAGSQPEIVTSDIPWSVDGAALSHDREQLAFVVNEDGMSRLYLMDARSRDYRAVAGMPIGIASGLVFSPDDRRLAMTLNTPQTPSDSFVLELDGAIEHGALVRWTESEVGGLDTESFITPALVHYPTFDRVDGKERRIPAWVYRPSGSDPVPVVISIHGGPEGQSRPYFSSVYQMWLDKLDVAVVVPNVRGSAGYGKSYLALDNGMKREDAVRDIGALLDWIAAEPGLDESRVAVYGGSYGGYMVLASAVHYSDRLRAAVDIVGISNFVTFLENTQSYRRDLRRAEYGDERDPEMRAFLERISPLNNVAAIKVPMLVVQGQNDPRVPVTESEQMVNALRQQGRPVWYMNALNEGHGYRNKENRDIYQQAVVLFLERHLLGQ